MLARILLRDLPSCFMIYKDGDSSCLRCREEVKASCEFIHNKRGKDSLILDVVIELHARESQPELPKTT